ncbi:MAG: molybdopterin molybdotransferase MoeA, partial [Nannocystaceae bacterium]
GPPELAMLLALERPRIKVYPRPSVAILSTGDELLEPGMPYKAGGVHSSNGAMLAAQVHHAGGEVITNRVIPDDLSQLTAALSDAANADLILTSGGVSVGDHDHLHDALRGCGATVLFRRVRMRPGRPLTVAACQGALVCALPGNPASSWATFELIARPALRHMAGVPKERARLLQLTVPIAEPVTPLRTRALFLRAMLSNGQAHPLEHQASGNLASLIGADCLVEVPAGDSPVPAGTSLSTYVIGS